MTSGDGYDTIAYIGVGWNLVIRRVFWGGVGDWITTFILDQNVDLAPNKLTAP